jgi:hypothetical protein
MSHPGFRRIRQTLRKLVSAITAFAMIAIGLVAVPVIAQVAGAQPAAAGTYAPVAYIANNSGNSVTVVRLSDNSMLATIPITAPTALAESPDASKVYVIANGLVSVISTASNTVTDVLVDIVGWFTTGSSPAGGTTYVPLAVSQRLSAAQTGGASWGPGVTRAVTMAGVVGIPSLSNAIRAQAVVTDIHTVSSTGASYLTAFPSATKPATSDLDFAVGQNLQNMTVAGLGSTGAFNLYNLTGNVTIPIDVFGWFG